MESLHWTPSRVMAVVRFEMRRTATPARLVCWAILALFPPAIVALTWVLGSDGGTRDIWAVVLYTLVPSIVCVLALLLWAAPTIQSEVEGSTWMYLAVRPYGRSTVLLGKYLNAVCWTGLAALTGLTVSIAMIRPDRPLELWSTLATIALLSTVSYAAVFTFLGVLIPKRAVVVCVAYTTLLELAVATVPAVINRFTVQYRLRSLMFHWVELDDPNTQQALARISDTGNPLEHILILAGITIGLMVAAIVVLKHKVLVDRD